MSEWRLDFLSLSLTSLLLDLAEVSSLTRILMITNDHKIQGGVTHPSPPLRPIPKALYLHPQQIGGTNSRDLVMFNLE